MKVSRAAVATVAACLTVGLAGAPAAQAATKDDSATAKSAQKKKKGVTAKQVNSKLNSTRRSLRTTQRQVATARRDVKKVSTDMGALAARLKTAEGGLGTILAAAPQLVTGLQTLATAVQTQIAPGLQKLAAAVETQIAPGLQKLATAVETQIAPGLTELAAVVKDTIGPGLQRLGSAYTATEYGAVRAFARPAADTDEADFVAIPGVSANSPDIPDNGQGALVSATVPYQATESVDISLRAAIRSAESDGGATGAPAGQVGGILYAKCASIPGIAATNCAGGAIDPGQIVCAPSGPPPAQDFGPLVGSQPLEEIQEKDPATSFVAPEAEEDVNPTGETANADCTLPSSGLYELTFAVQFFDFPTSTTPGPTE